jgi:desulfoferrodoxin (superoxide reductase-like protein)
MSIWTSKYKLVRKVVNQRGDDDTWHNDFFPVVSMTCRSPLVHVEVDLKHPTAPLSSLHLISWAKLVNEPSNHDSTRVAFHRFGEASTTPLTITNAASSQSSLKSSRGTTTKPSRRRQPWKFPISGYKIWMSLRGVNRQIKIITLKLKNLLYSKSGSQWNEDCFE